MSEPRHHRPRFPPQAILVSSNLACDVSSRTSQIIKSISEPLAPYLRPPEKEVGPSPRYEYTDRPTTTSKLLPNHRPLPVRNVGTAIEISNLRCRKRASLGRTAKLGKYPWGLRSQGGREGEEKLMKQRQTFSRNNILPTCAGMTDDRRGRHVASVFAASPPFFSPAKKGNF